ncbi:putative bifunctional diguanylate cyclase/phosphodiesterase [Sphaerotilus hippei]|uniref:putative bifunctional diguanylate cyclase/phosphodiesterase n=1 Tax=Sphaerotilus hippei TaxID=744406 RepID=UPI001474787D|nr:bifunctional diguanylate cyclase/phosphodiesterase [Sphaerotilus hippei]
MIGLLPALLQVFESTSDGMLLLDERMTVIAANAAAEALFGAGPGELGAAALVWLLPGGLGGGRHPDRPERSDRTAGWPTPLRMARRLDGRAFPVELTVTRLAGSPIAACLLVRDADGLARCEDRLTFLAWHDAVTGLPNRRLLHERLRAMLADPGPRTEPVVLVAVSLQPWRRLLDADRFDQGLRRLVVCLHELVGPDEGLASLGSDTLALLWRLPQAQALQGRLDRLRRLLSVEGSPMAGLHHAIGVARSAPGLGTPAELLQQAERALLRSLEEGAVACCFYSASWMAEVAEHHELEVSLHHALERGELTLHYQPKVDLVSGRVRGAEALMRWTRADGRGVEPTRFIAMAEANGDILSLGAWALQRACAQAQRWQRLQPGFRMAVNLSPCQLADPDLCPLVERLLAQHQLPPSCLELEVTESVMMDRPEQAIAVVRQLRQLGVRVALDDFGTGHSSLSHLSTFDVDTLKIDRSFVVDLAQGGRRVDVVHLIISLARTLQMQVVAEGVERPEQLAALARLGCGGYQGFLCSPAVAAEQFEAIFLAGIDR